MTSGPSVARALLALLLILVLAVALTAWRGASRGAQAEAAFPPEGAFVEVNGRRVHYVQRGAGPDLVLVHGASGNNRDMTFRFMDRLTGRYRVTAFDRPGLGYTDRASPALANPFAARGETPMEQADLLRAAARALGIERPIVLGHSYGGSVAMAWGLGDPEGTAAIVDVSGATMPWRGPLNWTYEVTDGRLSGAVVPWLAAAWAPQRLVDRAIAGTFAPHDVPDAYAERLGAALSVRAPSFRANARQVNSLLAAVEAMAQRYPTFTTPLEIVHGDLDTIVGLEVHSRPLAGLVPGARLTVLEGVGHMPHHTHPEAVIAAIDRARARAGLEAGGLPPGSAARILTEG